MVGNDDVLTDTPILPAHIEDTVQAIAKLHADHRRSAGALQRVVQESEGSRAPAAETG